MSTNLAGKKEGKFPQKQRIIIVAISVIIFAISVCLFMWLLHKNDVSVDKTLTTLYEDEEFVEAEYEEKKEIVEEVLTTLYKQGLIREKAVYDEKHRLYTYQYKDGTLGGVSLQEFAEDLNQPGSGKEVVPVLSKSTGEQFKVVVFNAFEDVEFRTKYYETLYSDWEDKGIGMILDNYVTIEDLKTIDQYDAVIFSMHGTMYKGSPILAVNEKVTIKTDKKYYDELKKDQSVAKVYCTDGAFHYWVFPNFFSTNYEEEAFEDKVIYSESCAFFGCDCTATEIDCSYSNVFLELSAECVFGYHNSVGAQYSRDVMKYTLERMFEGVNAKDALSYATECYGKNDKYEDISKDKYLAYPVLKGNMQAVVTKDSNNSYKVLADYIGKTVGDVKAEYGMAYTFIGYSGSSMMDYQNLKIAFLLDGYYEKVSNNNKINYAISYGDKEAIAGLNGNMKYSEIVNAVGASVNIGNPERWYNEENARWEYSLSFVFKGYNINFSWTDNPNTTRCTAIYVSKANGAQESVTSDRNDAIEISLVWNEKDADLDITVGLASSSNNTAKWIGNNLCYSDGTIIATKSKTHGKQIVTILKQEEIYDITVDDLNYAEHAINYISSATLVIKRGNKILVDDISPYMYRWATGYWNASLSLDNGVIK